MVLTEISCVCQKLKNCSRSGFLTCLAGSCKSRQGLILVAGSLSNSYLSPFTFMRKALKGEESPSLEYFLIK